VPNQGSTMGGGWQPIRISPGNAGWGRRCEKESSLWSSQVCSRQSSGRRLRTFPRSRRKTSQYNPEFTAWPVGTGASRYHNCCIDGGTSPEYFGYHLVYLRFHISQGHSY
jgi:hypothetical protein